MKLILCHYEGCNNLSTEYYCPLHKAIMDKKKPFQNAKRTADYHTSAWQRLSKQLINEVGCCQMCGVTSTLSVHHVVPVRECPERFLDKSNLIVLCRSCHQKVTAQEIRNRNR